MVVVVVVDYSYSSRLLTPVIVVVEYRVVDYGLVFLPSPTAASVPTCEAVLSRFRRGEMQSGSGAALVLVTALVVLLVLVFFLVLVVLAVVVVVVLLQQQQQHCPPVQAARAERSTWRRASLKCLRHSDTRTGAGTATGAGTGTDPGTGTGTCALSL